MKVRTDYNYDADDASLVTGLECLDESLTVQSEAADADINVILDRFGITGQLPSDVRQPKYGDFTDAITDYRTAVEVLGMAQDSFMSMPAKVRTEFNNDPQEFLAFCENKDNLPALRKMGLAVEPGKALATLDDVIAAIRESKAVPAPVPGS